MPPAIFARRRTDLSVNLSQGLGADGDGNSHPRPPLIPGKHYNLDHPNPDPAWARRDTVVRLNPLPDRRIYPATADSGQVSAG